VKEAYILEVTIVGSAVAVLELVEEAAIASPRDDRVMQHDLAIRRGPQNPAAARRAEGTPASTATTNAIAAASE